MTMEPWQSWLVVTVAGGCIYYYYAHNNSKAKGRQARAVPTAGTDDAVSRATKKRDEPRAKRKTESSFVDKSGSDASATKERGRTKKGGKTPAEKPSISTPVADDVGESEDKEWARQLAGLKKGTNLAPPARSESRQKTVKQSAAHKTPGMSANSSTTGADADDDLSPAVSPALQAQDSEQLPSGHDVADMLEPAAPGPASIRLIGETEKQNRKPQRERPFETKETKKQRQNRKKAEEKRLQREQEEAERRVLMEKQRRTAREARGEPAKNGMGVSKPPTSNPWSAATPSQQAASTAEGPAAASTTEAPLLDTFDHDNGSTASSSGMATSRTSATTPGTNWERDMPSEEEQMRMLEKMKEEGEWSTVPAGKKGRRRQKTAASDGNLTSNENSDRGAAVKKPVEKDAVASSKAEAKPTIPVDVPSAGAPSYSATSHPQDSDWAVV